MEGLGWEWSVKGLKYDEEEDEVVAAASAAVRMKPKMQKETRQIRMIFECDFSVSPKSLVRVTVGGSRGSSWQQTLAWLITGNMKCLS
ncbi:hypothetical protein RUM44_002324 [Polyplax serrata]|uniref:Uncharacterized protein n=1 Tax=Polyplax serrata TaxID=468196 RepID=A0ABR1AMK8_POLSC